MLAVNAVFLLFTKHQLRFTRVDITASRGPETQALSDELLSTSLSIKPHMTHVGINTGPHAPNGLPQYRFRALVLLVLRPVSSVTSYALIDLFRSRLTIPSKVFQVVFVHLVHNTLFLATRCCSFLLRIPTFYITDHIQEEY